MAKQNVTFVERHLEKLVIGAAGAVLLAAVVMYLVSTPNKVDDLGPKAYYARIDEEAERALNKLRNPPAGGGAAAETQLPALKRSRESGPREMAELPGPYNPPVPDVSGEVAQRGTTVLAEILPPTRPVATSGKAAARVPPMQEVTLAEVSMADRRDDRTDFLLTQDWHWVTLCAAISRKAQREKFAEAGYEIARRRLIVADVQAERQELLPDGRWGNSQIVVGYRPRRLKTATTIELVKQDQEYRVEPADRARIAALRAELETREAQEEVLRPAFQPYLQDAEPEENDEFEWVIPASLTAADGTEIDLEEEEEYGVVFPPDEDELKELLKPTSPDYATTGSQRERDRRDSGTGPQIDIAAMRRAKDQLEKAEELIEKKDFIEAYDILDAMMRDQSTPTMQAEEADKLLDTYRREFELAEQQRRRALETKQESGDTGSLGPDNEPIWLTDTSVEPGKTYRYRLRLAAVNQYAGMTEYVKNVEDASRLIVDGEWSEWSDPVTVEPDRRLFFTGTRDEAKSAKLTLYEWVDGKWRAANTEVGLGQPIEAKQGRDEIIYNAVMVDLDLDYPFRERRQDGNGPIRITEKNSALMTLVSADGQVEQRVAAVDIDEKRAFKRAIDDRMKLRKAVANSGVSRSRTTGFRGPAPRRPARSEVGAGEAPGRPAGREDRRTGRRGYYGRPDRGRDQAP